MRRAKRENYELIYGDAEVTGDLTDDVASIFHALYETIRCGKPFPVTLDQAAKVIDVIEAVKKGTVFENA